MPAIDGSWLDQHERFPPPEPHPSQKQPQQQIGLAFGISINRDVVRRILAVRYQPRPDATGPSWLTVLDHAKDSLWRLDLFRCESAVLRVCGATRPIIRRGGLFRAEPPPPE